MQSLNNLEYVLCELLISSFLLANLLKCDRVAYIWSMENDGRKSIV